MQVDKSEERVVPTRVETSRQVPSQPLKTNANYSYDSEPIQGRSFKVLQQITEPKSKTTQLIKLNKPYIFTT